MKKQIRPARVFFGACLIYFAVGLVQQGMDAWDTANSGHGGGILGLIAFLILGVAALAGLIGSISIISGLWPTSKKEADATPFWRRFFRYPEK